MTRTAIARTDWLDRLPETFSHALAANLGLSDWALARLLDEELLEQLGRGWYTKTSSSPSDPDLLAIAARKPMATLCLRSALARHGLCDDIPLEIDIALPAGTRPPKLALPIVWHRFDAATFDLGRQSLDLGAGYAIGMYSPERSIIDAMRLRRIEGAELGYEALRRWLSRSGSQPAKLLTLASFFARTERPLRTALEILL